MSKETLLFSEYLNTPAKAGVLLSMILWSLTLRAALAFQPVNKILPRVTQSRRQIKIPTNHILRYLYWLKKLKIINPQGDCLAQSLLYYRFLSLAGESPTLIIGFKGQEGHAWVEMEGNIISESPRKSTGFSPTLALLPGAFELSPLQSK